MKQIFYLLILFFIQTFLLACDHHSFEYYDYESDRNAHKCLQTSYGSETNYYDIFYTAQVRKNTEKKFYVVTENSNNIECLMIFTGNYEIKKESNEIVLLNINKTYIEDSCNTITSDSFLDNMYNTYIKENIIRYIDYHYYFRDDTPYSMPVNCTENNLPVYW